MATGIRLPGSATGIWITSGGQLAQPASLTFWKQSGIWINAASTIRSGSVSFWKQSGIWVNGAFPGSIVPVIPSAPSPGVLRMMMPRDFRTKDDLRKFLKNEDEEVIMIAMAAYEYFYGNS
jgi:hypothetical protein